MDLGAGTARRAASWAAQCAALARAYVKGVSGRVAGGAVWISWTDAPAPPHWDQMLPPRLRKTLVVKAPATWGCRNL